MAKIKVSEMHDGTEFFVGRGQFRVVKTPHCSQSGSYAVTLVDMSMSVNQKPFTVVLPENMQFEVKA